jgi:putative tryptophan/tyrosine transport system substrate-binding protein
LRSVTAPGHSLGVLTRREWLTAALAALTAPRSVAAQSTSRVLRVGLLSGGAARSSLAYAAFEETLRSLGYVDGTTLQFAFRTAEGRSERRPGLATELVRSRIDVLVAPGSEATLQAARGATTTLPIVVVAIDYDPIERGYVASLARPGGNITGVFFRQLELTSKRLELARELVPKASRMAVLWDADAADQLKAVDATARSLNIALLPLELRRPPYDYAGAMRTAVQNRAGVVFVLTSVVVFNDRARIAVAARQHRVPTIYALREHVEAGGLLAYGANIADMFRPAAVYVDRIHRGARPAELPVEQPTKFELVINLTTARALAITIPPALLARADHVIE